MVSSDVSCDEYRHLYVLGIWAVRNELNFRNNQKIIKFLFNNGCWYITIYICSYLTDLRSSSSIKNNIKLLSIRTILLAYMRLLSFQERDYVLF